MITITPDKLVQQAQKAAEIRHQIHQHPECGLNLLHTQAQIVRALKEIGITEIHEFVGGPEVTGVVALIRGTKPGRVIGLRADSDALPLVEETGAPWASQLEAKMHACGHDGHVATLLAVCDYAQSHHDFAGTLVAIFQPGEEGYAGARFMLEDGLLERFGIDEFYALHAEPSVECGKVAFVSGYATANADKFKITFTGKGGHGSRPHLARDPIVAASSCVMSLQTVASRTVPGDSTAVVSVCSFQAGKPGGTSVIPEKAVLIGTTRTFEPETQETVIARMQEIVQGTAATYGMTGELEYEKLYPAMYNNPALVEKARLYAASAIGAKNVGQFPRTPGGEDFSFMLLARPGCLFRLGMKDENHFASVHNPRFDFNDKAIATGAATLLTIALNRAAAIDE